MKTPSNSLIVLPAANFKGTIAAIQSTIYDYTYQTAEIASGFTGKSIKEQCRQIWQFLRTNVAYKNDRPMLEEIRTPGRTWADRKKGVDCEDYVIWASTVLRNKGITHSLRVADYGSGWAHIYLIIPCGMGQYITLDAVKDAFNVEEPFVWKIDYKIKLEKSKGLSGISSANSKSNSRFETNRSIEQLLDSKSAFTASELNYLRNYSGSGGKAKDGATGEGVLYEFYTPDWITELMWEIAQTHGYDKGPVLEPGCATGVFLDTAPKDVKIVGFEINPYSAKIAQLRHPNAVIYNQYLETAFLSPDTRFRSNLKANQTTWLKEYPFSLVIGNPPYGIYQNQYSSYFPELKKKGIRQIEMAFMYWGMKLLKPKGLMVFITNQNFLRTGIAYQKSKEVLGEMAELIDAYRLPAVFESSQVPTDILVFRKK